MAGRAVQILIDATGAGFSAWQLKKMMPHFHRNLTTLKTRSDPYHRISCGGNKWHITLLVADAAQMYEQVDSSLVLQAFDAKVDLLQSKKGATTITVDKGCSVKGWPGGSEHTRSRTKIIFSVQRLRRMVQASCFLRFASIGSLVVQAKGLVIGGLLSMIAAICLLSHEEEQFLQSATHRNFQLPEGWTIRDGMRYVDDLLLVSHSVCHSCLQKCLLQIYSVGFNVNQEEREQTWTDIVFNVNPFSGDIKWTAKNPNRPWIQSISEKAKQRRVPFLGRLQCPFGVLRNIPLSRAARLKELELPEKLKQNVY